ncbi:hypothetical protein K0U07_03610 [bacterium]|nr:hypothetical protein [bacterium]
MNIICIGSILMLSSLLGTEVEVKPPKRITEQWEEKVLGVKHGPVTLDVAVEEKIAGYLEWRFDKGLIERIKAYIEKHPTGVYEEYWANKQLKVRLPYKDKKPHGHIHGWFINGEDAFKGHFSNGVKQGYHITFTDPKYPRRKGRVLVFNEQGQIEYKQKIYHPKGKLWIVLGYKKGVPHGALEAWDEKGKELLVAQYKNGVLQKDPPPPPIQRDNSRITPDQIYVREVTKEFLGVARKEFGVRPYGVGASMPNDVEAINITFSIRKKGSIPDGRELVVKLTKKLVEMVNKHEKLRPYLREYPFTDHRAEISIIFCDELGRRYTDDTISHILVNRRNEICYLSYDNPRNDKEIKERYADAVKLVYGKGR